MDYLKNDKNSIVCEIQDDDNNTVVTKEIISERGNFGKVFSKNDLLKREIRCLELSEKDEFSPNIISIDSSNKFSMESFSHMKKAFEVPEKFKDVVRKTRDSFKKMEEAGFLKIGMHHSEIFWDEELENVKIVDYGEVHFLEEGSLLTFLIKVFNEVKFGILYLRMLKKTLIESKNS